MKSWVEVNRGALRGVFHGAMLAPRRYSVNLAATVGVHSNFQLRDKVSGRNPDNLSDSADGMMASSCYSFRALWLRGR